ncbi:MAG: YgcG family protein [Rhizobiaceae bacterium]|nr:YgcG family protein [Rhizobiaceae bacterium]
MVRAQGRGVLRALAGAVLLLVVMLPALAQTPLPALTGRVVDNAGIIDAATEASLTAKLAAFEAKSSDQIVVATLRTLGGEAIESYANRLFREWGLGQAGEDNGILLLVALDDRKMRIEVGYGLEGTLTDLHAKLIIENTMVPAFRAGDFSGGIDRSVDDIILVLEGNAAELEERYERNQPSPPGSPFNFVNSISDWSVAIFIAIWALIFIGALFFAIGARIWGRRIAPGRYRWLGMDVDYNNSGGSSSSGSGWSSGGSSWSSGSSSGGGFSGGGGSSGGGGASGSW